MAQNQKTDPTDLPAELPILSVEEEALIEAWAAGHNQSMSYRLAYNATGYSPESLKVRACRKFAEPKIQQHMRALQSVGLANVKLTVEDRLAQEIAFAQRAEDAGNFGAAGGTHDRVNKLLGLYVDKFEDVSKTTDPVDTLKEIARHSPDLAQQLAAANNIPWESNETATKH